MGFTGCWDASLVLCCIVGIFLLTYIYRKWQLLVLSTSGIPGPSPTIFIGHFKQFVFNGLVDPSRRLRKQYGKVYRQYVGLQPFIFVHDLDILREVLVKRFDNFTNRKTVINSINVNALPIETTLSFSRDTQWYRLRRIMTAAFTGSKIRHMCGQINAVATVLAGNLGVAAENQESCSVRDHYIPYAVNTIIRTAFGLQANSQNDVTHPFVINATQLFSSGFLKRYLLFLSVALPFIKPLLTICRIDSLEGSAYQFLRTLFKGIIDKRKKQLDSQKNVEFLQILIDSEQNSILERKTQRPCNYMMSPDEMNAQGLLFFASSDGISTSLSFLSHILAAHPDIQTRLFEEIHSAIGDEEPTYDKIQQLEYLDHIIRETLRLYPPIPIIGRETANTVTIKGYTFPKGSTVIVPSLEIQRDPDYFDHPHAFRPDRWKGNINPLAWLPFGYGQRQCLAVRLAMLTIKIAVIHVLRRVKFVAHDDVPKLVEVEYLPIGRLVPKETIKLSIELRDKA
ncbi:cytochrome P450 3A24-like isoform X2 [Haliotis asinina]